MAADLKDMLKRVLASEGKKKFFFAYGSGKRKDKKGEGELAVRGSKPKKAEIEAALTDAGEVFEGNCWLGIGPDSGQTVYFQSKGKKLSKTIVTAMTKTAKTTAGTQYDFQMPSPEEEARAEKLGAGEGEQPLEGVPPAPPGADVPPAPPLGSAPPTQPTAPPSPPAPPLGGAEVMKRLNAMAAAIKAAMLGPNKARVQALFVSVNGLIKNKDFVQAGKVLDELEPLVAKSAGAPTATSGSVNPKAREQVRAAVEAWQLAVDTVKSQITKLQAALKASADEELVEISSFGLNGVTGNHQVKMMAAIMELRSADGATLQNLAKATLPKIAGFQNHLAASEQIAVCDGNPFDVTVTIGASIGGALTQLEDALQDVLRA